VFPFSSPHDRLFLPFETLELLLRCGAEFPTHLEAGLRVFLFPSQGHVSFQMSRFFPGSGRMASLGEGRLPLDDAAFLLFFLFREAGAAPFSLFCADLGPVSGRGVFLAPSLPVFFFLP